MEYKSKHFALCLFDPLKKDILGEYPVLSKVSSDVKLLKYIIAMYDQWSPFIRTHRDVKVRKQVAAQFAGYDLICDLVLLDGLFTLKDPTYRMAVMTYLKEFAFPRDWFMICANEQTFYEYGERMMEPITKGQVQEGGITVVKEKDEMSAISVKSKLSQDMEVLNERIEKGYRKLFNNDDDIEIPGTARTTVESMSGKVG